MSECDPLISDLPMLTFVDPQHALRSSVEALIKEVYADRYSAHIDAFPKRLICLTERDAPVCAAGLRDAAEQFFSELYLDQPVETLLTKVVRKPVERDAIFEVTSLVSHVPQLTPYFVQQIVNYGHHNNYLWCFFTATRRLRLFLERLRLRPHLLCSAEQSRIRDFNRWGSYYAADPRVVAVSSLSTAPTRIMAA